MGAATVNLREVIDEGHLWRVQVTKHFIISSLLLAYYSSGCPTFFHHPSNNDRYCGSPVKCVTVALLKIAHNLVCSINELKMISYSIIVMPNMLIFSSYSICSLSVLIYKEFSLFLSVT